MNHAKHKPNEHPMRTFRIEKGLTKIILDACGFSYCAWYSIERKGSASTFSKRAIRDALENARGKQLIECTDAEIDTLLGKIKSIEKDFAKKRAIPECEIKEEDSAPDELSLGWFFLQMRKGRRKSQKEWAQMLGVHLRIVQRLEKNQPICMENESLIIEGLKRLGYNNRVKNQLFGIPNKKKEVHNV